MKIFFTVFYYFIILCHEQVRLSMSFRVPASCGILAKRNKLQEKRPLEHDAIVHEIQKNQE